MPGGLMRLVDDFWHRERHRSRSAAMRALLEAGLGRKG